MLIKLPNKQTREYTITTATLDMPMFRKAWMRNYAIPDDIADTNFFPCLSNLCRGNGRIYDPNEQPCPVEGNKMRSRIRCPKCHGTGRSQKKEFMAFYKATKQANAEKRRDEKKKAKELQAVLNKINHKDFDILFKNFRPVFP